MILPREGLSTPPVKSIRLPNAGRNRKGVRLIVLDSLLAYLGKLEQSASAA